MRLKVISIPAAILCSISVLALTVSVGFGIFSALKYRWPERYLDPATLAQFSSNDAYWKALESAHTGPTPKKRPSEWELLQRRTDQKTATMRDFQNASRNELIHWSVWSLLFGILVASSWSVLKRYAPDH